MEYVNSPRTTLRNGSYSQPSGRGPPLRGPTHSTPVKGLGSSITNHNTSSGGLMDSYREDSCYSDLELSYDGTNSSSTFNNSTDILKTVPTSRQLTAKKSLSLTHGDPKHASYNSSSLSTSSRKSNRSVRSPFATVTAATEAQDRANEAAIAKQVKLADAESQTVQKQRAELSLLVTELRDRDNELNAMVTAHQKQLAAWDADRCKIAELENKCAKLERDMQGRSDDVRALAAKLRVADTEDQDKSTALNNTQQQLVALSEEQSATAGQMHDLEHRNRSLTATVHELSCSVGQLEAREQELVTVLQLKDRDLSEAASRLVEVGARLKKTELQYSEARDTESESRRRTTDWKNKCGDAQRETDYTKKLLKRSEQRCDEQHVEIQRLRQELSTHKKELTLAGEREKRKDQLLDLQRSKQERTDSELTNMRQLYERQQKDLSLLHVNLESTKDLLFKNNIHVPGLGSIGMPKTSLPSSVLPSRRGYTTYSPNRNDSSYRSYSRDVDTSRDRGYSRDPDISHDRSYTRDPDISHDRSYTTGPDTTRDYRDSSTSKYTAGHRSTTTDSRSPDSKLNWSLRSYDNEINYENYSHPSPRILNDNININDNINMSDNGFSPSSLHSNGGFHDDEGLEVQLTETPPSPQQTSPNSKKATNITVTKETSVKETDSSATKLHKLLTESRDMVEELEKSVVEGGSGDNPGENQGETPSDDNTQKEAAHSTQNDTSCHGDEELSNGYGDQKD